MQWKAQSANIRGSRCRSNIAPERYPRLFLGRPGKIEADLFYGAHSIEAA
jgi:hypothetical protein